MLDNSDNNQEELLFDNSINIGKDYILIDSIVDYLNDKLSMAECDSFELRLEEDPRLAFYYNKVNAIDRAMYGEFQLNQLQKRSIIDQSYDGELDAYLRKIENDIRSEIGIKKRVSRYDKLIGYIEKKKFELYRFLKL